MENKNDKELIELYNNTDIVAWLVRLMIRDQGQRVTELTGNRKEEEGQAAPE